MSLIQDACEPDSLWVLEGAWHVALQDPSSPVRRHAGHVIREVAHAVAENFEQLMEADGSRTGAFVDPEQGSSVLPARCHETRSKKRKAEAARCPFRPERGSAECFFVLVVATLTSGVGLFRHL